MNGLTKVQVELVSLAYQNRSREYAVSLLEGYGFSESDLTAVLECEDAVVVDAYAVSPSY